MSIRKSIGALGLATAALIAGMAGRTTMSNGSESGTRYNADKNTASNSQQSQGDKSNTVETPRQMLKSRRVRGFSSSNWGYACTPKEWGMWLQHNRRQKWNKKISHA
jgi:hypothetical protein